ncbi:MAG: hypothetical protein JWN04_3102 [Myxococcaceae bacterium]|nr:hypothetical protein [Myxococcaceae bacterium]
MEPMLPDDPEEPRPQPTEKPSSSIDEPASPSEPDPTRKVPASEPPVGDPVDPTPSPLIDPPDEQAPAIKDP